MTSTSLTYTHIFIHTYIYIYIYIYLPIYTAALHHQPLPSLSEPCLLEGWGAFRPDHDPPDTHTHTHTHTHPRRRWPCLRSMALFNDAFPAPIQPHRMTYAHTHTHTPMTTWAWVPTVELTTHFWERPPKKHTHTHAHTPEEESSLSPPFLRLRFVTSFVRRGLLMCDSEVWAEKEDVLYSSSRQYARVLEPR
jgi:hypothetical protein